MLSDPSTSPDSAPQGENSFKAKALMLVSQFEDSVRSGQSDLLRETVDELTGNSRIFTHATTPLLSSYCSRNPRIQDIAAQMLFHRTHWIERSDLNELVIPCVANRHSTSIGNRGVMEVLYGIASSPQAIDEKNISPVFHLAGNTFRKPDTGEPFVHHAILSLFGSRIPNEQRGLVFRCCNYVLTEMTKVMHEGDISDTATHPADPLFTLTIAGLIAFSADLGREQSITEADWQAYSEIVWNLREFVDATLTRIEGGTIPEVSNIYQFLLAYPFIDAQSHVPTRQSLIRIAELLRDESPPMNRMLLDMLGAYPKQYDFMQFADGAELQSSSFTQLRAILVLCQFTASLESGADVLELDPPAEKIATALDTLRKITISPIIGFHIQRAERALHAALTDDSDS